MGLLFRAIIAGIGWKAGEDIYEEGKKKVREEMARQPKDKSGRQLAKAARAAEKASLKAEKERATAAKKREKTVENELAALKQKMGR